MPEPRLLIRLGSLGDVVLSTAAANAARERWGDRCLDVLVKSEFAEVWQEHPAVRRLLAWPPAERGAPGLLRWARRLRSAGYAETIDLQGSPRTRALTRLAGLSGVRRPRRHATRRRLLVAAKRWGPPAEYRVVEGFVAAVAPGSAAMPSIHPGEGARSRARELIPGDRGQVGLLPGARHATKRWPLERFVEVGRWVASEVGKPVPVFFGPGDQELLRQWKAAWFEEGAWFPIREDLATAAACLGRLAVVVTNDTGLMHVAAAMGTPVAAVFGPTVRAFGFAPTGRGHRILETEGLACRPCTVHGGPACPRGHFRCMFDVETQHVRAAVSRALAGTTGRIRSLGS